MIIAIAVGGAILGLATLFLPRGLMLFGERWTLRNGEDAEPSEAYVLYVRVTGVVILVATAAITIWMATLEHEQARRAELEELWDVQLYGGDDIVVIADPRIETSQAVGDDQVVLSPTRTAVVGRDELGDLGSTSFEDGDVLVGMGHSSCDFSHLAVRREDGETVVGIVVNLPEIPALPGIDADPPHLDPFQAVQICTRRFASSDDDPVGLTVFRVPGDD